MYAADTLLAILSDMILTIIGIIVCLGDNLMDGLTLYLHCLIPSPRRGNVFRHSFNT